MNETITYDAEDISKFLELSKSSRETEYSKNLKKLLSVQKKIPIIDGINAIDLKEIIKNLKFVKYNYRDYIITEGETSQEIFFILSGECQVFSKKKKIATIESGKSFGEAAIFNTKRNASVVCSSKESTLLSFSINHENMDFCAPAIAQLYKNIAFELKNKLEAMNENSFKP